MLGRSELLAKLEHEAAAWDAGSGDVAALLREAKAEIEHLAGAAASHFQQAMLNGEKAQELHAALRLVMDYPEVRTYLGSQVSNVADAALGAA